MNKIKDYLWKRTLATIMKNVGFLNLFLRLSEFVLRNVDQTWEVPNQGYANDIVDEVDGILDDGKVGTVEIADSVKFFRTGTE